MLRSILKFLLKTLNQQPKIQANRKICHNTKIASSMHEKCELYLCERRDISQPWTALTWLFIRAMKNIFLFASFFCLLTCSSLTVLILESCVECNVMERSKWQWKLVDDDVSNVKWWIGDTRTWNFLTSIRLVHFANYVVFRVVFHWQNNLITANRKLTNIENEAHEW